MTNFKNLHNQEKPLLIANVWDAVSAQNAEKLNFQALGTSSSAVAAILGYQDGEQISFDQLEFMAKHIAAATSLPLSVDMEGGYSRNPSEIADNIKRLADIGVVGINFEDSVVAEKRIQLQKDEFVKTLQTVKNLLEQKQVEMFLNVRTDAFLVGNPNPVEETIPRIKAYEEAGADGIFVPFIKENTDIQQVTSSTKLPINVLSMAGLPDFQALQELGVKRISMGGFVFKHMYQYHSATLEKILKGELF